MKIHQNKNTTQYGFHVMYDSEDILLLTSVILKYCIKTQKNFKNILASAFFYKVKVSSNATNLLLSGSKIRNGSWSLVVSSSG